MVSEDEEIPTAQPLDPAIRASMCRALAELIACGYSPRQAAARYRQLYIQTSEETESPWAYATLRFIQVVASLPDCPCTVVQLLRHAAANEATAATEGRK